VAATSKRSLRRPAGLSRYVIFDPVGADREPDMEPTHEAISFCRREWPPHRAQVHPGPSGLCQRSARTPAASCRCAIGRQSATKQEARSARSAKPPISASIAVPSLRVAKRTPGTGAGRPRPVFGRLQGQRSPPVTPCARVRSPPAYPGTLAGGLTTAARMLARRRRRTASDAPSLSARPAGRPPVATGSVVAPAPPASRRPAAPASATRAAAKSARRTDPIVAEVPAGSFRAAAEDRRARGNKRRSAGAPSEGRPPKPAVMRWGAPSWSCGDPPHVRIDRER
jgi:hypothetical protein